MKADLLKAIRETTALVRTLGREREAAFQRLTGLQKELGRIELAELPQPDLTLSTGRVVRHTRMPNGATDASIVGPDGPEMTPEEWEEYCRLIAPLPLVVKAKVTPQRYPNGRWG